MASALMFHPKSISSINILHNSLHIDDLTSTVIISIVGNMVSSQPKFDRLVPKR